MRENNQNTRLRETYFQLLEIFPSAPEAIHTQTLAVAHLIAGLEPSPDSFVVNQVHTHVIRELAVGGNGDVMRRIHLEDNLELDLVYRAGIRIARVFHQAQREIIDLDRDFLIEVMTADRDIDELLVPTELIA